MLSYIKLHDYKLGDIELDFHKNSKTAYNTIVLVGENGSGKTTVLERVRGFLNGGFLIFPIQEIRYFDNKGEEHAILAEKEEKEHYKKPEGMLNDEWEQMDYGWEDVCSEREELYEQCPEDIRNCAAVFSEARSNFDVNLENDRHLENLDDQYEKEDGDYSGLVRLLCALQTEDEKNYLTYMKNGGTDCHKDYMKINSKMYRFKNAYEEMYDDFKYSGCDWEKGEQMVYFRRGDSRISVDNLSSGEKQIFFRGADLLYHAKDNAIVLIDEPELSLHPRWQMKIFDFYRNLFKNSEGKQNAQIIMATHSEYIIEQAMKDTENVKILILKKENQKITTEGMKDAILKPTTAAEVSYLAFGIRGEEYHEQLYAVVAEKLGKDENGKVRVKITNKKIEDSGCIDATKHIKTACYNDENETLPVYIRNRMHHPETARPIEEGDLETAIDILRKICQKNGYHDWRND